MKVLWVSLVKFPPLCKYLQESVPEYCGWLYASAEALLTSNSNVQLGVVIPTRKEKGQYKIDNINYYLIPVKGITSYSEDTIDSCRKTIDDFRPDIIHIHGTEFSLGLAMAMANKGNRPIVANIQGIAGACYRYADGGLSVKDMLLNIGCLDLIRKTSFLGIKESFRKRGRYEGKLIHQLTDIVGRTMWDRVHSLAINPTMRYHFLNETLRSSFYTGTKWDIENCERHTIFVSNSGEPLKGAHNVIKALPFILRYYPDACVKFVGFDVLSNDIKKKIRMTGYRLYLRRLIRRLNLQKNIEFLGVLSEEEMKKSFLSAHVYVMPSAIENSPNSLCEAQILGVPAIASYCGGVSDLVENKVTGFYYRYEEYEMLAQLVINVFSSEDWTVLSNNERDCAMKRHDRQHNANELYQIYVKIVEG